MVLAFSFNEIRKYKRDDKKLGDICSKLEQSGDDTGQYQLKIWFLYMKTNAKVNFYIILLPEFLQHDSNLRLLSSKIDLW